MKVSFDFDGTLARESIQRYAKELISKGIDVHIVTSRFENSQMYDNFDLFEVAREVGIKKENIHFSNMIDKCEFFKENPDFIWHLDDDYIELKFIQKATKVKAISAVGHAWKHKCDKLLTV